MAAKPPPVCKVILLCDEVLRDPVTNKTSVIGIFDTFVVPSFPGSTSPCTAFLKLVDAFGEFTITAEIHDLKEGTIAFRSSGSSQYCSSAGRSAGELWFPIFALLFTHPGPYDLIVFADENEIDRVQFNVRTLGDLADA